MSNTDAASLGEQTAFEAQFPKPRYVHLNSIGVYQGERQSDDSAAEPYQAQWAAWQARAALMPESATPAAVQAERVGTAVEAIVTGLGATIGWPGQSTPPPAAAQLPAQWTPEEIERGHVGIRWVTLEGVAGRPTQEDALRYLPPQEPAAVGAA